MNNDSKACDEVILVLGAGIVNYMNYQRAKKAVEYNHNTFIIPTGGKGGFLGKYMKKTEAEKIKDYLCKMGVEQRLIQLESDAKTTEENFTKYKNLIDLINPKKVIVVTNKAHMKRAVGYAEDILKGYQIVGLATSPKWYDITGHAYELGCWVYEHTKIPIEKSLARKVNKNIGKGIDKGLVVSNSSS